MSLNRYWPCVLYIILLLARYLIDKKIPEQPSFCDPCLMSIKLQINRILACLIVFYNVKNRFLRECFTMLKTVFCER